MNGLPKTILNALIFWVALLVESIYQTFKKSLWLLFAGLGIILISWPAIYLIEGKDALVQNIDNSQLYFIVLVIVGSVVFFIFNLFVTPIYWEQGERIAFRNWLVNIFHKRTFKYANLDFEIISPKNSDDICLKVVNNENNRIEEVFVKVDDFRIAPIKGEPPLSEKELFELRKWFPQYGHYLKWRHKTRLISISGKKHEYNYGVADIAVCLPKSNQIKFFVDEPKSKFAPPGEYYLDVLVYGEMEKRYVNNNLRLKIVYKGGSNINIYIFDIR